MITKIRHHVTKNGRNAGSKMAVFVLEDLQGSAEAVLFPKTLDQFADMLVEDKIVFVRGKVDTKREKPNIFVEDLIPIEDVTDRLAARVKLRFDSREMNAEKIKMVRGLCERNRGRSAIDIVVVTPHGRLAADADSRFNVNPNVAFCKGVKQLIGADNFKLCQK
jgi:DNA polymerase-3 subunit alpha